MSDFKLLIANSAVFSMLAGLTKFKLIDSSKPEAGFVGQQFRVDLTDPKEVFNMVLFKEKLQYVENGVTFGSTVYLKPAELSDELSTAYWILAVSIQDVVTDEIGKVEYQTLKRHVYRLWFNVGPRRLKPGTMVSPTGVEYDGRELSWRMDQTQFKLALSDLLPPKKSRKVEIRPELNAVMIKETNHSWFIDLAFRNTGWDGLVKNKLGGSVLITLDALKANLTRNPLVTDVGQISRELVFDIPEVVC